MSNGGGEKGESASCFSHVNNSLIETALGVGQAVYTLYVTPDHDHDLFKDVGRMLMDEPQPLQATVQDEVVAIVNGPAKLVDTDHKPSLSRKNLLGIMGVCMQFTCHVPRLRPYAETPFEHIDNLFEQITLKGNQKPLDFSDQLTIALLETSGDLPEAIWRLFLTSRQHARWLDSSVIIGMPDFTRDQKMERMYNFSTSVAACRPQEIHPAQDASGDTYYSWTHALGGITFRALAGQRLGFGVKAGGVAMHNGTRLIQEMVFRLKPQTMWSDHSIAATYGNAIGEVLADILNDRLIGLEEVLPETELVA